MYVYRGIGFVGDIVLGLSDLQKICYIGILCHSSGFCSVFEFFLNSRKGLGVTN